MNFLATTTCNLTQNDQQMKRNIRRLWCRIFAAYRELCEKAGVRMHGVPPDPVKQGFTWLRPADFTAQH